MVLLTNSFEGGTSGTTIDATNSGGASGSIFDVVVTGAGTTNAFDSTHAAHGALGYANASSATAASCWVQWTTSLTATSITQVWFRAYLYYTALPGVIHRNVAVLNGATTCAVFQVTTAGKIRVVDTNAVTITTSATTIPLNQWFRIEGYVLTSAGGTTGQTEVKLFLSADSTVADETNTSAATQATLTAITKIGFGNSASIASVPLHWLDDLGASDTGYIGPAAPQAAAGSAPAQPGRTWLRRFRHRQAQPPSGPAAVTLTGDGTALAGAAAVSASATLDAGTSTTLAGAGQVTAAATVIAPAALAGAGSIAAVAAEPGAAAVAGAGSVTDTVTQAVTASLTSAGGTAGVVTEAVTSAVTGAGAVTGTVTQDAGTATSLAGSGAVSASALVTAPPVPAYAAPGRTWLRRFRHPRQPAPGQPARAGYDGAVMADSPVAYWNDATGADLTGHGHTLTLVNSPTSATMADGGAAYLFDGSTQYCDAGDDDAFSPVTAGRFTIEAWIRPDTLQFPNEEGTGYVYWAGKNQYNPAEWACRMYSLTNSESRPNRISGYAFNSAGGSGIGSFFQDTITAGEWIHYVLVINTADAGGLFPDGYTKIYKNGVQRDQDDLTGITLANTAAPLRIGSVTLASYFQGAVGRIAIYPAELSAARVLAHFQAMPATASLAGAGAVTANASVTGAGNTAAPGAAGSITTVVTQAAAAAAQGAGQVAAVAAQAVTGTAAAAGQVTATAAQGATAAVTAAGSITAAVTQAAAAAPQAAGSVTGAAVQIATASLAGAGAVTATASSSGAAGAAITAAGAVTAKTGQAATVTAAAAGQLATAATQAATATAAGAGSVNASGVITGTANLAAASTVAVKTAQAAPVTAAAAGTLAALAAQRAAAALAAAAALNAAGTVQVAFTIGALTAADAPSAVLTAAGTASALTAATAGSGSGGDAYTDGYDDLYDALPGAGLTASTQTAGGPS